MSRRSRRQNSSRATCSKKTSKGSGVSAWLLRIGLGLLLLIAVLSVGGYLWMRNYLAGESFRALLVKEGSAILQANVVLSPLRWDGFRVHTNLVEVSGEHQCKSMKWDGIRTGIEPGRIAAGVWSVAPTRIGKISILWDTTAPMHKSLPMDETAPPRSAAAPPWYQSLLPRSIEAAPLIVDNSDIRVILKDGSMRLHEARWEVTPSDNLKQANVQLLGGKLSLPLASAPSIRLNKAQATYRDGNLYLTQGDGAIYERGNFQLTGEWDAVKKALSLEGDVEGVQCSELLLADWKQKLMGSIVANFQVASQNDKLDARGHLKLQNGMLTALPVLDTLAAYAQSIRFRTLALHDAECDFHYQDGVITLTRIKIGSEGLARIEGRCMLSPLKDGDYSVDGDFQLGLAPGTLSAIPGAEEEVFHAGSHGLRWSPLRMTGTLKNPQEDLTGRLRAAAGARMFEILPETGVKVLKYTKQVVDDHAKPLVESVVKKGLGPADPGIKAITEVGGQAVDALSGQVGETVNDAIGGVLQGLLGNGGAEPPKGQAPDNKEAPQRRK
jgi:hypothetical protein